MIPRDPTLNKVYTNRILNLYIYESAGKASMWSGEEMEEARF